jgi:predicted DNA-binding transcriptional regulator YafY
MPQHAETLPPRPGAALAPPRPGAALAPPRPGAALALLAAALRTRRVLDLRYAGALRRVHPHAVGRTARGRLALLAWQVADERSPAHPTGWRLFDLSRLQALEPRREHFQPRGGLGPRAPIARPIAAA